MLDKIISSSGEFVAVFYNQRYMGLITVKIFPVGKIVIVFAHALAVVRSEYDQGIVIQAELF